MPVTATSAHGAYRRAQCWAMTKSRGCRRGRDFAGRIAERPRACAGPRARRTQQPHRPQPLPQPAALLAAARARRRPAGAAAAGAVRQPRATAAAPRRPRLLRPLPHPPRPLRCDPDWSMQCCRRRAWCACTVRVHPMRHLSSLWMHSISPAIQSALKSGTHMALCRAAFVVLGRKRSAVSARLPESLCMRTPQHPYAAAVHDSSPQQAGCRV